MGIMFNSYMDIIHQNKFPPQVEQSISEEERLLYEQSDLRIEVVELTRLSAIKVCLNL